MIPCTGDTKKGKSIQVKVEQKLPKAAMLEKWKMLFHGYRVPVWDDEKVLETDSAQPCDHS